MGLYDYEPSQFATVCQLARGGMGRVEIAVRRGEGSFERLYAVKRLHSSHRTDPAYRSMFIDEARIAGAIQHSNVVSVLDVGEDERGPFLVMEYVDGVPLSKVVRHHAQRDELLPVQLCAAIGAQAAAGLHAAHVVRGRSGEPLGIVHRDLTPQNVLVGYDGTVRVTDFGVAKAANRLTHTATGVLKGKFGYMSPEQLRYEEIDPRSDLFSLGVVLYELLACRRLYGAEDNQSAARMILNDPPPDLDDVRRDAPPELVALLFELLAKDRDLRPASATDVASRLKGVVDRLRVEEGPIELADYMQRVFRASRKARRDKIEMGLRLLDGLGDDLTTASGGSSPGGSRPSWSSPTSTTRTGRSSRETEEPRATERGEESRPKPARTVRDRERSTSSGRTKILVNRSGNVIAMHGNCAIQVRAGSIDHSTVGEIRRALLPLARQYDRCGFVAVIEENANIPPTDIRRAQRAVFDELLAQTDARLAVLVAGDGVMNRMFRSAARLITPGRKGIAFVSNVTEATLHVREYVDPKAIDGLRDAIDEARELAKR
ncbi:MAG: serine/threonine protein kinase [Deltaproteobacteria bacterium]|nr:serine/threonine protein kinase [Deltaproteobacteria bacterium]